MKAAFPEDFILHAMALKANSIRGVLLAAKEKGLGAECASICETVHALSLGFPPEKVVFDSPCKTRVSLSSFPTDPLTTFELQNTSQDFPELHKIRRPPEFEVLKL